MKLHLIVAGSVLLSTVALAACSSTVGTVPPTPAPSISPLPPSFQYVGTTTQTFTYQYGYPSQQPPYTVTTNVAIHVTEPNVPASAMPPGAQKDLHIVEIDATSLQTTKTTTDAYVASRNTNASLFGSTARITAPPGGQSSVTKTLYVEPRTVSKSGGTWTNSPASTIDETYSDGHFEDRTIGADGTYVEKGTTLALSGAVAPIVLREQSTGAGSYAGPFEGCPADTAFHLTAPSGSPVTIDFSATSSDPYCSVSPALPIDAWYPAPPHFYDERDTAIGSATAPTTCGTFAGKAVSEVKTVIARLDTIIGYVELTTIDSYVQSSSPVCIALRDDLENYYDWQGDTPSFFAYSPNGKPISEVETSETLTQSSASGSASELASDIIAGAQAHFAARVEAARAKLLRTLVHHMQTVHLKTGGK